MKKLQQFYILKILSNRLKNNKFALNISLADARKNDEVISIANSEMIRRLFKFLGKEFSQVELDELLLEKKKKSRNKLEIIEKIDDLLFIPSLVSIEFNTKNHYLEVLKRGGFHVNGKLFTPFMASAGMVRRNTALFIDDSIRKEFTKILECGRNKTIEIVPAKWNAYFSLYSSSSLPVTFPKFAIVKDCVINTTRLVDFVTYQGVGYDDAVEQKEIELECNAFDGGGLVSPKLAEKWSKELELDYISSTFVIRAPFLKGMVATFDFHEFAKRNNKKSFIDIYGNTVNVENVDLIVSESMAKLWNTYKSTNDYVMNCIKNSLGFSVSKVSPKIEKNTTRTSYQFLQILNLTDAQIENICKPTVDWFKSLYSGNAQDMIMYSVGENTRDVELSDLDYITQALIIDDRVLGDDYISNHFRNSLKKKVKQSFMGNILLHGNYQIMISDPYAQAEYIFGLPVKGLLKEFQHYSNYWNENDVKSVVAIRSPAVHSSEVNLLNLQNNELVNYWYKHIKSGIIYPAHGIGLDMDLQGGGDVDGDITMTTDCQEMIDGRVPSLPIFYKTQKANKEIIDTDSSENLVKSQILGYNSQVGYATNVSTSLYALREEFPENSLEYETINKRLKILRAIQGEIIDSAKGLDIPPFRYHWVKYKKVTQDLQEDEVDRYEFYNKILCDKRPSYFRFLYDDYNRRHKREMETYNNITFTRFGLGFDDLREIDNKTLEQAKICDNYKRFSYFIDNGSVMNRISRHMQKSLKDLEYKRKSKKSDPLIFMSNRIEIDDTKKLEMLKLYKEYKSSKAVKRSSGFNNEQFVSYIKKKAFLISGDVQELANLAIQICYLDYPGGFKDFAWKITGDGIIANMLENSENSEFLVPVLDKQGEIKYLWNRYSLKKV